MATDKDMQTRSVLPIPDDSGTPVSDDYGSSDGTFTGRVQWVQLDAAEAAQDEDHVISPEERVRVAMARQ